MYVMFVVIVYPVYLPLAHGYIWPAGGATVTYMDLSQLIFFLNSSREKSFIDIEHNEGSQKENWNHQEAYEKHFYFDNQRYAK